MEKKKYFLNFQQQQKGCLIFICLFMIALLQLVNSLPRKRYVVENLQLVIDLWNMFVE